MFSFIRLSVLVSCLLFLLAACGGGGSGGGGGAMSDPPMMAPPSAAEVRADIADIRATANTLRMTDLVTTSRSAVHANTRGITTCRGGTECSSEPAYEEPYWSLHELADLFSDASLRVEAPLYGVNNVVLTGRTSSVELDEGRNFTTDHTVYGGWLSTNFFGVKQTRYQGRSVYGSVEGLEDLIAFSGGTASGSNPVTGSAEWNGLVLAVDAATPTQPVNGKAAMTYDFTTGKLDVDFTNLRGSRAYPDLQWQHIDVQHGRFESRGGTGLISGTFYGDAHQEVGGIFERSNLIGAFGATR